MHIYDRFLAWARTQWGLRSCGAIALGLAALFIIFAVTHLGARPAMGTTKGTSEDITYNLAARENLISGTYKVYGLKDRPASLWLAKTVFRNDTGGTIKDLKVRYRLGEYSDWSAYQRYPAMVPTQTVVDLYHPILSSRCANLNNRAPALLEMQAEYVDAAGNHKTIETNRDLTLLGRQEFYFTDLKSEEQSGSYQDTATYSDLLAAWVTSNDQAVAALAGMANKMAKGAGASTNDKNCLAVMRQLYEIMRVIKVTYQSPAATVQKGKDFDYMLVQSLQYPRDTIQKRSGTCIDLAILYAAMMHAVGIKPYLVTLDGHCFPMAQLPESRQFVAVEATGVGGGGQESKDFDWAVNYGIKEWSDLQKNGRFTLVDCETLWGQGVSPPELEPLPADIMDKWHITDEVNAYMGQVPAEGGGNVASLTAGNWNLILTTATGATLRGQAKISTAGAQYRLVVVLDYTSTGADGIQHNAHEEDVFLANVQQQMIQGQCNEGTITVDQNQKINVQNLPYTLKMQLSPDGHSASGTIVNAANAINTVTIRLAQEG